MKNLMRNLTLSAAALAALVSIAPKASADDRGRDRGGESRGFQRREPGRQQFREHGRQEWREHANRGPGRYAYAPPVRAFYRRGYATPFRVFSGFRFFSYCPGPGYLYIANYGWVLPPFPGAVWVPDHTDIGGFFVEGMWR
jgi:hypothetical protein